MAFVQSNLTRWAPTPATITQPNSSDITLSPIPLNWGYYAGTDTISDVSASGYFQPFNSFLGGANPGGQLALNDLIWAVCTDGYTFLSVTAINPTITTAVSDGTIPPGTITNAMVSATAGIAFSKLATLNSGNILVGSAGNVATSVALTGPVSISNAGVTALGAGSVLLANLGAGIAPSSVIKYAAQYTTVGGAAAEAVTISGALATDLAFVQLVAPGTNTVSVGHVVMTSNTMTVTFSGNPGNNAIINYQITRAAS